jgi:hypothetical protein
MTETFISVVSHRFAIPGLPVMVPLAQLQKDYLFGIFEFGTLGFV